jgi:hypothetical protein
MKKTFTFYARDRGRDWFPVPENDAQFAHAMSRNFATECSLSEHKFRMEIGAEHRWEMKNDRGTEFKVIRDK